MITKTSKAVQLWREGKKQQALSIFKTFKLGLTKEEQNTLRIASEMEAGLSNIYQALGYQKDQVFNEASAIVERNFL